MTFKDFKNWHKKKREVHNERPRVFFDERDVWFCHLGENIGFEQDGRGDEFLRPVLVLKKFNKEVLWALPLTKTRKTAEYYYQFSFGQKSGSIILSQLRLIDAKRLKYKAGTITEKDFALIKQKIRQFLA